MPASSVGSTPFTASRPAATARAKAMSIQALKSDQAEWLPSVRASAASVVSGRTSSHAAKPVPHCAFSAASEAYSPRSQSWKPASECDPMSKSQAAERSAMPGSSPRLRKSGRPGAASAWCTRACAAMRSRMRAIQSGSERLGSRRKIAGSEGFSRYRRCTSRKRQFTGRPPSQRW